MRGELCALFQDDPAMYKMQLQQLPWSTHCNSAFERSQFNLPFYVASEFAHHHRNLVHNWMHAFLCICCHQCWRYSANIMDTFHMQEKHTSLLKSLWAIKYTLKHVALLNWNKYYIFYTYVFFDTYKIFVLRGSKWWHGLSQHHRHWYVQLGSPMLVDWHSTLF